MGRRTRAPNGQYYHITIQVPMLCSTSTPYPRLPPPPRLVQTQDEGGFSPFGLGRKAAPKGGAGAPAQLGVNGYLWRATLDTLSFMPLANADPWGGVINYSWYIDPQTPNERFKATVYILDTRLRADGLNVTVFKQVSDGAGGWTCSCPSTGSPSLTAPTGAGSCRGRAVWCWADDGRAVGCAGALVVMAGALLAVLIVASVMLPGAMGTAKQKAGWAVLFAKTRAVNVLALNPCSAWST